MNRRTFIGTSAAGGTGLLVASQVDCGGPSVSGVVKILSGGVSELLILFPGNPLLSKIVKLATDFDADWTAGKFASAKTFFESLDTTVSQVISDLGLNASTRIKLLLASLGIALRVLASLIAEQAKTQPLATQQVAPRTASRINQLADAEFADRLLQSVKQ